MPLAIEETMAAIVQKNDPHFAYRSKFGLDTGCFYLNKRGTYDHAQQPSFLDWSTKGRNPRVSNIYVMQ